MSFRLFHFLSLWVSVFFLISCAGEQGSPSLQTSGSTQESQSPFQEGRFFTEGDEVKAQDFESIEVVSEVETECMAMAQGELNCEAVAKDSDDKAIEFSKGKLFFLRPGEYILKMKEPGKSERTVQVKVLHKNRLSKIKFQGISLSHMYDGMYENLCHFDARPILEKQFYAMHSESMASGNISSQKLRPMVSVSWEVLGGEFVFLKHRKMGYAGGGYGYSDGFGYGSGGGGMGQMSEFHKAIVFKDKAIYTIRATMKTPEGLKFEASMELDTAKKYDEFGDRVQASILLEGSNFYVNEKIALTAKIEIKDEALHEEDLMFMWMVRQPAYYNESQYDPTAPQESGTQYELENENSKEARINFLKAGSYELVLQVFLKGENDASGMMLDEARHQMYVNTLPH